jgi:hypothetical protein
MANTSYALETSIEVGAAILFYDRQRRMGLKRMPLGSPFVLPRVGELVRLPVANDVATEYCVVDVRYVYRDRDDDGAVSLECGGRGKKPPASERLEGAGLRLECVRVELDPLI